MCVPARIQTEPGVYIEIVFGVKGDFLSARHGCCWYCKPYLPGRHYLYLVFSGSYSRTERMVDVLTELDVVLRHGV